MMIAPEYCMHNRIIDNACSMRNENVLLVMCSQESGGQGVRYPADVHEDSHAFVRGEDPRRGHLLLLFLNQVFTFFSIFYSFFRRKFRITIIIFQLNEHFSFNI